MSTEFYDPIYADRIVQHLAKGQSIRSFAGKLGRSPQTIYNWKTRHPEFGLACEIGEAKREEYLVNMGHMMATGQLRRVVREDPVLDARGRQVTGDDGKPITSKIYAHVRGEPAVWIFMMRNMCKWTNRDLSESAPATDDKLNPKRGIEGIADEDLRMQVDELYQKRARAKKTKAVKIPTRKKKRK